MWANLIATSGTEDVSLLGQYIEILSNITSSQVLIIEKMISSAVIPANKAGYIIDKYHNFGQSGVNYTINAALNELLEQSETTADDIINKISSELRGKAIAIDTIYVHDEIADEHYSDGDDNAVYSDDLFLIFENLKRMGIIEKVEVRDLKKFHYSVDITYYLITPVGIDLYACCNPDVMSREM